MEVDEVRKRIRQLRDEKGLKAHDMAEMVGISRPFYTQLESGARGISAIYLFRIAKALEMTVGEVCGERLKDVDVGQMKTFILLGLCAGLRKSEIFNLRWEDIDWDRRELVVRITKGKRSRRIPLSDELEEGLRLHPKHGSSNFVIHNTDGSQWKDVRRGYEAALERAGLPRMRIHDMRHSFISNLVAAGVDLHTVKELAGHRDIRTTLKYSHLALGQKRESIERMSWGS